MSTKSKPRFAPIEHKTGGYCYKCRQEIVPGTNGYWDNSTDRRLHAKCGDEIMSAATGHQQPAWTSQPGQPQVQQEAAPKQELMNLAPIVEEQARLFEAMQVLTMKVDSISQTLSIMARELGIRLPGAAPMPPVRPELPEQSHEKTPF